MDLRVRFQCALFRYLDNRPFPLVIIIIIIIIILVAVYSALYTLSTRLISTRFVHRRGCCSIGYFINILINRKTVARQVQNYIV